MYKIVLQVTRVLYFPRRACSAHARSCALRVALCEYPIELSTLSIIYIVELIFGNDNHSTCTQISTTWPQNHCNGHLKFHFSCQSSSCMVPAIVHIDSGVLLTSLLFSFSLFILESFRKLVEFDTIIQ